MPEEGMTWLPRSGVMSFEEIERLSRIFVERFEVDGLRLTGGEPTIRAHLPVLVAKLAQLRVPSSSTSDYAGRKPDISVTTNGATFRLIGEPLRMADYRAPKDPRQDRMFLLAGRKGEPAVDRQKAGLLRRSGYPLASLTFSAEAPLSQYLQFIHYVVFGLGWLRGMDFVTAPGVESCASIANMLHQNSVFQGGIANTPEWNRLHDSPRQLRWRSGVVLHYDRLPCGFELAGRDAPSAYAALVHQLSGAGVVEYGELTFFGDTRYSAGGKKLRRILDRAASQLFRDGLKVPADVSEGPAMNHTCHEMVAGHGRCLSTVLISEKAESSPATGSSADYNRAQFLAVQAALEQRGRLVVSITLRDLTETSLKALDEFFRQAAAQIRRSR